MLRKKKDWRLSLLLLPFLLLVTGFLLLPLMRMIWDSFQMDGGGGFTFEQYGISLTNPFYTVAIRNSLLISLLSGLIGLVVGWVAAYSLTRIPGRMRDAFLMFSNMTSNFAGVPLAFAYMILLGNNGLFTLLMKEWGLPIFGSFDLYSWGGLVLVYVYFQVPLAILLLYPSIYGIREEWKEASSLLGASKVQFWIRIGFPILLPGIVGTFSILFANAMGAYATAYALVGGNYNLLAIRIGALVSGDIFARPELASALAVLLGAMMLLAMWINERMMRFVRRDLQ
ncbi:ABC transporter permease [Thermicanus aegyptius]|uniref:ABC transporter permease n=1 Tax=Thermicanus aegyptius TaxID=94009 RepID=UPI000419A2F7|nr:ABC transporter permease subunit [Thermicanus aegyptius]